MPRDFAIYGVHAAFWAAFGVTRLFRRKAPADSAPAVTEEKTAPHSRALLVLHMFAFGTMYFGLANAVIPDQVPERFPGQRIAGTIVIAAGAALASWALVWFRSWRFRAKLDAGHELATGGPFAWLRHPIYMALDLLAIGTALWCPTAVVAAGAILMVIGSDLRGRAEEKLLEEAFGDAYRAYRARTRRFLPGLY